MNRFEIAIEVAPIDAPTIDRLKADGFEVFRGSTTWRVQTTAPILSSSAVRAQAHALALKVVDTYGLVTVSDPVAFSIRDPDAGLDERPDLVLDDAHRAEDRPPMPRAPRKWYQRAMELGLGERKGD